MPTPANALAVMAKAPIPGMVKTRLVPPLTYEQAAELSRALLLDQLAHLALLSEVALYLAFTPPQAQALMASLAPSRWRCFPQQGADLGERMKEALAELWWRGHRNVALIGSDVPAAPLEFFHRAFEQLSAKERRVVFGPSRDGGYYLVGMNRLTPEIFDGMTWSHDRVLSDAAAKLARLAIDFQLLPVWFDLDTTDDIERLRASDTSVHAAMKNTVKLLERLGFWRR